MGIHFYIIGMIGILMLVLAVRDWRNPSANARSIIVSLGVFGTFAGIT